MAPEYPPFLVIFDARFEGAMLKGAIHYVETANRDRLRVSWNVLAHPQGYIPVGHGIAYVYNRDVSILQAHEDATPDPLGNGRYQWTEGLNSGLPWLMFVLILPEQTTLSDPKPTPLPSGTKLFQGRLALYWILNGDAFGRTKVECTIQPFQGELAAELVRINQAFLGAAPEDTTVQVDEDELVHLRELISVYNKRRRLLEKQVAQYGSSCPPNIQMELDDTIEELQRLEAKNDAYTT